MQHERNEQMIEITLSSIRVYRQNDSDKQGITVGPGVATVPAWVAEAWGLVKPAVEGWPFADASDCSVRLAGAHQSLAAVRSRFDQAIGVARTRADVEAAILPMIDHIVFIGRLIEAAEAEIASLTAHANRDPLVSMSSRELETYVILRPIVEQQIRNMTANDFADRLLGVILHGGKGERRLWQELIGTRSPAEQADLRPLALDLAVRLGDATTRRATASALEMVDALRTETANLNSRAFGTLDASLQKASSLVAQLFAPVTDLENMDTR